MPDIQTEIFTKVLPKMKLNDLKFDDDVGTEQEVVVEPVDKSANLMKAVWETIHANPGITAREISDQLAAQGISFNGVSTRLKQLLDAKKLMRNTNASGVYSWFSVGDTYQSMSKVDSLKKATAVRQAKANRKAKAKAKAEKKVKPVVEPTPVTVTTLPSPQSVDEMLSNLSIVQARAMYDALKKIFGA